MGEGAQFRNAAVGGFHKEDVLRYIEMMKQSSLESTMKLDQTARQLQDAQRRVHLLEAQLKQSTEEAARLSMDNQSLHVRVQQAEEQARQMGARLSGYEEDKSKLQAVELQIGSLMVSAHMYSNKIVSQARQEAERITQQASMAIDQATNHINILSVDAESAQGRYQSLFHEVSDKIEALSSSLQEAGEQLQAKIRRNVAEAEQALREELPLPAGQPAPVEPPVSAASRDKPLPGEKPEACASPPAGAAQAGSEPAAQEAPPDPAVTDTTPVPAESSIDYSRFIDVISGDDLFSEE